MYEERLLQSKQFKQWERLGLAARLLDDGEAYLAWTDKGRAYAEYFERKMAEQLALGSKLAIGHLDKFDKEGYALVDEE